jgi:CRP-like cAMP-binding protein
MNHTSPQIVDRLQHNELFGLFPSAVRSQLYNKTETRFCKNGDVIFRQGEEGDWFAAILAGRVHEYVHAPDGRQMLLSIVERGEIFGERSLLDGFPRASDAIADGDTTFIIVKRDDFLPVLFGQPEAMYAVIKMLCNRMLRYTETLQLCTLENLSTRVAHLLLHLARKYGKEVEGRTIIHAGLSQSDLAHLLASSRESVNKQLKIFVHKGCIALEGENIVILDQGFLESLLSPEVIY